MAETRPAQWVTLHNIKACFIREMWFVDCSCIWNCYFPSNLFPRYFPATPTLTYWKPCYRGTVAMGACCHGACCHGAMLPWCMLPWCNVAMVHVAMVHVAMVHVAMVHVAMVHNMVHIVMVHVAMVHVAMVQCCHGACCHGACCHGACCHGAMLPWCIIWCTLSWYLIAQQQKGLWKKQQKMFEIPNSSHSSCVITQTMVILRRTMYNDFILRRTMYNAIIYFCELQEPLSCHLVAAWYLLFFLQLAVQCGKTSPQLTGSLCITHTCTEEGEATVKEDGWCRSARWVGGGEGQV